MNFKNLLTCLLLGAFLLGCSEQPARQELPDDASVEQPKKKSLEPAEPGMKKNRVPADAEDMEQQVSDQMEEMLDEVTQDLAQAEQPTDPGEAYLFINAKKPGVKVLPSGLQFEILESGDGRSPGPTDMVKTHYEGSFVDGTVFDSSVQRGEPATFPVNRVIAGWTEALQMMKEGDKWRLVIPSDLAYGERGAGGGRIPPNSVLVFEVELIEVEGG